ncbi:MAG: mechanosensitive ion channel family protein, partial [Candidatus Omnitrophica bacterium]|nr:mechanosensitive ion channel family protein [Candidatus Omnitrophota bacterium]
MDFFPDLIERFATAVPFVATLAALLIGLFIVDWILLRRHSNLLQEQRAKRQVLMVLLTAVAVVLVTLSLPLDPETRNQLLGLLGLLLSGVIGISSTTFVSNAMAALMLRSVKSFRIGDFLRVGEHFGRVTEQGLFHTEIQTEDRDLTTLPNLYLVTNPTSVIRSSGTIVSATVSLGYDVPRMDIESCLLEAAQQTGLEEPFVQV